MANCESDVVFTLCFAVYHSPTLCPEPLVTGKDSKFSGIFCSHASFHLMLTTLVLSSGVQKILDLGFGTHKHCHSLGILQRNLTMSKLLLPWLSGRQFFLPFLIYILLFLLLLHVPTPSGSQLPDAFPLLALRLRRCVSEASFIHLFYEMFYCQVFSNTQDGWMG